MGFGHRVYKNYDPRAKLIKRVADDVFAQTGVDPKLEIALELERIALEDDYFVSRKLYPNVDFYSGTHLPGDGLSDRLLHGAVRARPAARLARAVGGDALRSRSRRSRGRGRSTPATTSATSSRWRTASGGAAPFPRRPRARRCARGRSSRRRRRSLRRIQVRRLFIERSSVPSGDSAAKVVNALTAATSAPACVRTSSKLHDHDLVVRERAEPLLHHRAQRVLAVVRPHAPEIEVADVVGVEVEERVDVLRAHGRGVCVEHLFHAALRLSLATAKPSAIASRSSGESGFSSAARPGRRCSRAARPDDDRRPAGRASSHASARVAGVAARARAPRARRRRHRREGARTAPGAASSASRAGARRAAAVLAGQPAARERAERREAEPVLGAERQHLVLRLAVEQRVRVLHASERAGRERLAQLRAVDVAERRRRRSSRAATSSSKAPAVSAIGTSGSQRVREVQVDALDAEPAQARTRAGAGRAPARARDPRPRPSG